MFKNKLIMIRKVKYAFSWPFSSFTAAMGMSLLNLNVVLVANFVVFP